MPFLCNLFNRNDFDISDFLYIVGIFFDIETVTNILIGDVWLHYAFL